MPPPLIQIIQDPEFQNLPESEKIKAFQMFGATDPEWRGLSTRDKLKIQAYAGITRAQQVLARVPDTAKGPEGGVNLPPAVDEYVERAGRYASAVPNSIEELKKTASINAPLKTSLAAANAVFSPLYAGAGVLVGAPTEEAMSGAGIQNETAKRLVGEIATQAAMAAGMHWASPAPTAVEQAVASGAVKKAGGSGVKVVDTPKGRITVPDGQELALVDTPDGAVELNPPGDPALQMRANEKYGPDASVAIRAIAQEKGIPEPKVTVGQTQISRSYVDEAGQPHVDLANGTTPEAVHEMEHVEADIKGTEHPPEDNNAILSRALEEKPQVKELGPKRIPGQYPEGTTFTNKGRTYSVSEYDEATDSYTAADEETGREFVGFSPEAIAAGGAKEPRSSVVLPKSEPAKWNPQSAPISDEQYAATAAKAAKGGVPQPEPLPERSPEVLAPEEYEPWQRTGSDPMRVSDQERYDPSLRGSAEGPPQPKNPGALAAENFRSAGVEGPKEALAKGEIPEDAQLGNLESPTIGKERKWKPDAVQPLPDTPPPSSPVEAQDRRVQAKAMSALTRKWAAIANAGLDKAGNAMRGFMTANPETAIRVFVDNQFRTAIDAVSSRSLRGFAYQTSPIKNRAFIRALDQEFPKAHLGQFQMEGQLGPVGKITQNFPLPWADRITKDAVFMARLERNLAKNGQSLDEIRRTGDLSKIPLPDLMDAKSVGEWISMQRQPEGKFAKAVVNLGNTPVGKFFTPFARMMYNRGLAFIQQSPTQWLDIASPEFRAMLAKGDPEAIRKAILPAIGMAAAGAGFVAARKGQNDPRAIDTGFTKVDATTAYVFPWYAVGYGIGRIDWTGKNPHSGQANINTQAIKSLAESVSSVPGVTWTALSGLLEEGSLDHPIKDLQKYGGTFSTGLRFFHHLLATVSPEEAKLRDASGGFWAQFAKNVPGLSQTLPEQRSPTRPGTQYEPAPLAQALGAPMRTPDTAAEGEMRRLGIRIPYEPIGDPEKDRAFREQVGPIIDASVSDLLRSDEYQKGPDALRHRLISRAVYGAIRKESKAIGGITNKDLLALIEEGKSDEEQAVK